LIASTGFLFANWTIRFPVSTEKAGERDSMVVEFAEAIDMMATIRAVGNKLIDIYYRMP
jgi:hypothetical protein